MNQPSSVHFLLDFIFNIHFKLVDFIVENNCRVLLPIEILQYLFSLNEGFLYIVSVRQSTGLLAHSFELPIYAKKFEI